MKHMIIPYVLLVLLVSWITIKSQDAGSAEFVKSRAEKYYSERGFKIVGYQGYNTQLGIGRCYWYLTERSENLFESCLLRWDGELHEYSLKGVNSVQLHTEK
jgi:hypothetical protein